jgi:hypothetical protein
MDFIMNKTILILLFALLLLFISACGDVEEALDDIADELGLEEPDELDSISASGIAWLDDDEDLFVDLSTKLRQAKGIISDNSMNNPKCGIMSDGLSLAVSNERNVPGILREVNRFLGFGDDLMREFNRTSVYDGLQSVSINDFTVTWWTVSKDGRVTYHFLYDINSKS